ncbi:hypothetical protein Desaci_4736 (plasmid) [Desulfosporosinus acidiphilus SJ4]|jgi:hypothetical protein|uniref:DUF4258 domain-containing protein n=1 Tax=Desulfosporosinus acidiphilus (strain DSM 22704 / JCM 16185 / SJ4) TaxID=646529 RepID=I4DCN9_DESAJ|nr:DUF4258 domain-containing protein [Desulfosporosinus acidiphilus]AFM43563.1 hypothetical protein Desaci_4736 [Desulfosporosinus acidiphilus SJ4]
MITIGEVRKAFRNKVFFSAHAARRMAQRSISPEDIRRLLKHPVCWAEYEGHPDTLRIDGEIKDKGYCGFAVAISTYEGKSVAVVITVMDDVRIQKRVKIAKERGKRHG